MDDFLTLLTTEDVRSMGAAWPYLNELQISLPINFDVLLEIVQRFPELRYLRIISLQLGEFENPEFNIPMHLSHSLLSFHIYEAYSLSEDDKISSNNIVTLAQCTDIIFPDLELLEVSADEPLALVGTIISAFKTARKDQETRILGRPSKKKIVTVEYH
ncbi:hypothetical protein CPB84DRAFT_1848725 [Gymnopilus junonius]|uniref:Uncharacterized protein n=1 Tax=Gymnopilus junonius TaxID=109634 RepID=A0A9P5TKH2_GYMJU|nr:hypothetical protein CPB84DRAFT_1848725 [Gymnopilus junonius]